MWPGFENAGRWYPGCWEPCPAQAGVLERPPLPTEGKQAEGVGSGLHGPVASRGPLLDTA